MDRTERFYKIDQLLRERPSLSLKALVEELGISAATFKRDIEYMRNRFNAPIVWDRKTRGYRFRQRSDETAYELPGLWFNASEIHALLTMRQLLADLQPGLLEPHIQPLLARLNALLGTGDHEWQEVEKRVRVFHVARRTVDLQHFEVVATALLKRRRLRIVHYNRGTDETSERVVSPQRLIHYRENWYLDAWCHLREAIRSFAVDALRSASILNEPAIDILDEELDRELAPGYGIFSGSDIRWAELRFTPERARWVSREIWHPKQKSRFEPDGAYTLEIPYSDDRELIMDILKHGAEVEVLAPESLRKQLQKTIRAMAARYQSSE
ncbi:YafY family protein [Methylocaldum sp.]|uniref:helix-turn-helix transcriptional regulator n=1 Tax=Methylocaldum sp. TaxID=1969727 RepID=UPI002D732480|nr:YafY family protein [Methylocaldum sp.]HYE36747.1 YafY family protein [Methylocaldum sp.]